MGMDLPVLPPPPIPPAITHSTFSSPFSPSHSSFSYCKGYSPSSFPSSSPSSKEVSHAISDLFVFSVKSTIASSGSPTSSPPNGVVTTVKSPCRLTDTDFDSNTSLSSFPMSFPVCQQQQKEDLPCWVSSELNHTSTSIPMVSSLSPISSSLSFSRRGEDDKGVEVSRNDVLLEGFLTVQDGSWRRRHSSGFGCTSEATRSSSFFFSRCLSSLPLKRLFDNLSTADQGGSAIKGFGSSGREEGQATPDVSKDPWVPTPIQAVSDRPAPRVIQAVSALRTTSSTPYFGHKAPQTSSLIISNSSSPNYQRRSRLDPATRLKTPGKPSWQTLLCYGGRRYAHPSCRSSLRFYVKLTRAFEIKWGRHIIPLTRGGGMEERTSSNDSSVEERDEKQGSAFSYFIPPKTQSCTNTHLTLWLCCGGKDMLALDWLPFVSHFLLHNEEQAAEQRTAGAPLPHPAQLPRVELERGAFKLPHYSRESALRPGTLPASPSVATHPVHAFVLVDYPGHGFSEGVPSPDGCVQAGLQSLYSSLDRIECDKVDLRLLGYSLGAAVALQMALEIAQVSVGCPDASTRVLPPPPPPPPTPPTPPTRRVATTFVDRGLEFLERPVKEHRGSLGRTVVRSRASTRWTPRRNVSTELAIESRINPGKDSKNIPTSRVTSLFPTGFSSISNLLSECVSGTHLTASPTSCPFEASSPLSLASSLPRLPHVSKSVFLTGLLLLAPFSSTAECASSFLRVPPLLHPLTTRLFERVQDPQTRWNNWEALQGLASCLCILRAEGRASGARVAATESERLSPGAEGGRGVSSSCGSAKATNELESSHLFPSSGKDGEGLSICIVHGSKDSVVPSYMGKRLFAAASRLKGVHTHGFRPPESVMRAAELQCARALSNNRWGHGGDFEPAIGSCDNCADVNGASVKGRRSWWSDIQAAATELAIDSTPLSISTGKESCEVEAGGTREKRKEGEGRRKSKDSEKGEDFKIPPEIEVVSQTPLVGLRSRDLKARSAHLARKGKGTVQQDSLCESVRPRTSYNLPPGRRTSQQRCQLCREGQIVVEFVEIENADHRDICTDSKCQKVLFHIMSM